MIAVVKAPGSSGYWSAPKAAETPRETAPAKRAPDQVAERRPYDWSNIVFAVDYCRETNREYESAKAS